MKLGLAASLALAGAVSTGALAIPGSAQATLHGFCAGAGQCVDNGTNSPTTDNAPLNFGFTTSPGSTPTSGDLVLDILTPDNETAEPSFGLTGTLTGTASLFSATPWTSGQLDAYLGISATPTNGIGAFLPSTQALDPGATGFFVYQVNLGTTTLQGPSNPNVSPLEDLSSGVLPQASYIVGFFNEGTAAAPDFQATANSGAIFETGLPGTTRGGTVPEPSTWAMMLLGFAGLGFAGYRKAHSARTALSAA
jgi:PEP-CTERM motif-containing protein